MRKTLAVLAAAVLLGIGAASAARPAVAAGAQILNEGATTVRLEANKGTLVRLTRPAATVFVAEPSIADVQVKSPTLVYVHGKKPGETTVYAVDAQDHMVANLQVLVSYNLARLQQVMATLHPEARISIENVDGAILLTGTVADATVADDAQRLAKQFLADKEVVLNRLKVAAPNQVNLRVRVAEVQRKVLKQLGFNWDAIFHTGGTLLGLATGHAVLNDVGQFITRTNGTYTGVVGIHRPRLDINGVIDALAQEGLVTVLAEPNLTAVSGQAASFLAGGEFPIPVSQQNNTTTIEFKKFGVSLVFTPTILADDRINLRVAPEVSELSNTGAITIDRITIPALTTRRAETMVELGSGQSFAIAGLLQGNLSHDIDKLPGLGEVPVLGALFKSDRFQRGETELVIIVTPYLVRPVNGPALASPTDGLVPPNDLERILLGRTQGGPKEVAPPPAGALAMPGRAAAPGRQVPAGPVGFMLD